MQVVGVDGCPSGWVAAAVELTSGNLTFGVFGTFAELAEAFPEADAIGVDIPIGLPLTAPRQADTEAKKLLPGKKAVVFPAPHPAIRHERVYQNAIEVSNALIGKGLSKQGFAILPKIAEVNDFLTPQLQERIFEVHPEVSFAALNGGKPILAKKATPAGFAERYALLVERSGFSVVSDKFAASHIAPGMNVHADDMLDAIVAAWTAKRVAEGTAQGIPPEPEIGFRGLKAQIMY